MFSRALTKGFGFLKPPARRQLSATSRGEILRVLLLCSHRRSSPPRLFPFAPPITTRCLHHLVQLWTGEERPPNEVLARLLEELEDLMAGFNRSTSDGATTPLVTPPEEEGDGGGGPQAEGGGEKKKGLLVETEAFRRWSHQTGELQNVPPLESVDLPGEKGFTEGCLKVGMGGVLS